MIEQELKMNLLRHWTLYDSIQNSNYLVTKLKIGKEPGMKTFKRFLVRIGFSIDQAKQKFQYVDSDLRNNLKRNILDKSTDEFDVAKILYPSFVR